MWRPFWNLQIQSNIFNTLFLPQIHCAQLYTKWMPNILSLHLLLCLIKTIHIIIFQPDMAWSWTWYLILYYCLFCNETMKKVWDYTMLHPYQINNDNNYNKAELQLHQRPYKDKSDFLGHIESFSIYCYNKMVCRCHCWLFFFVKAFEATWYNYATHNNTTSQMQLKKIYPLLLTNIEQIILCTHWFHSTHV